MADGRAFEGIFFFFSSDVLSFTAAPRMMVVRVLIRAGSQRVGISHVKISKDVASHRCQESRKSSAVKRGSSGTSLADSDMVAVL